MLEVGDLGVVLFEQEVLVIEESNPSSNPSYHLKCVISCDFPLLAN